MTKRMTITKAYIRRYSDNGQTKAYVEWSDGSRSEGEFTCQCCGSPRGGVFIQGLIARARREGVPVEHQSW
jgi:hypothetical protein